ncbi:MAG: acetolactate synthase small subunit [Thaumarchaeota archaeon]|nr:acetolactate synthase small subunit [Nitrososphaerota archaeon]MCZ6616268.1 acetolactate synthase small subunit [Nitrososphaerota archaeon]MCZ6725527.1 acetolactate synthase small subunit [Nitrososphaerota archaeon]
MTSVKIIAVLVENRPGVLFKVANMIRRRSFNIESITVGTVDHKDISRMTITLHADDAIVEQLVKQLSKLIDVIEANVFTPEEVIARELAIIQLSPDVKVTTDTKVTQELRIVESSSESLTVELLGGPDVIDEFLQKIGESNVLSVARTGITALPKRRN